VFIRVFPAGLDYAQTRFGVGYNLTLVKQSAFCKHRDITHLIRKFVPDCTVLTSAGGEMAYRLPFDSTPQFAALFKELELKRDALGIGGACIL